MEINLALDLDGVICNLQSVVCPELSAKLGRSVTQDEINEWHSVTRIAGFSEDESWKFYRDIWKRYKYYQLQPFDRNVGLVTLDIKNLCNRLDVVSAHSEDDRENIHNWLTSHDIHYDNLILSGMTPKVEFPYQVYIDDYFKTLKKVTVAGRIGICYNQLYNLKEDIGNAIRINYLEQAVSILRDLSWAMDRGEEFGSNRWSDSGTTI